MEKHLDVPPSWVKEIKLTLKSKLCHYIRNKDLFNVDRT